MHSDLRVLAGKYKGRVLRSPQSSLTHPMGSREKNALFNMLMSYLTDAIVLDAYAGSGALGIEALSRGAKGVVFVEKSPKISRIIQQNLKQVAASGHSEAISGVLPPESRGAALPPEVVNLAENRQFYQIYTQDVGTFAQNPAVEGYFGVVLADPPYDGYNELELAKLPKLLQTGGVLVVSYPAEREIPAFAELELLRAKTYAGAGIAIYRKSR